MRERGNPNLKVCTSKGHAFYLPTDDNFLVSRLTAPNSQEQIMHQCLRCEGFFLVPFHPSPIQFVEKKDIPIIVRGSHNKKISSLRFIALERWIRSAIIFVLALGLFQFSSSKNHLYKSFLEITQAAQPLAKRIGFDTQKSHTLHLIENALSWSPGKYLTIAGALIFYSLLQILEGYGLWIGARWGEYLAAVATAVFIPLEVYEVATNATYLKIGALLLNITILLYLLLRERLFGIRGGTQKYHEEQYHSTLIYELENPTEGKR